MSDDEQRDKEYMAWLGALGQNESAWYLDGRGDGVQAEYKRIIAWLRSNGFDVAADSLDADKD